jgi:hypothetical protein
MWHRICWHNITWIFSLRSTFLIYNEKGIYSSDATCHQKCSKVYFYPVQKIPQGSCKEQGCSERTYYGIPGAFKEHQN